LDVKEFVTYNESPTRAMHFTHEFVLPNKTKCRYVFEIAVGSEKNFERSNVVLDNCRKLAEYQRRF